MRKHSEIKRSDFVSESILTMLASEKALLKEWDNKADERWNKS